MMNWAEDYLLDIQQEGKPLEQYVDEFLSILHLQPASLSYGKPTGWNSRVSGQMSTTQESVLAGLTDIMDMALPMDFSTPMLSPESSSSPSLSPLEHVQHVRRVLQRRFVRNFSQLASPLTALTSPRTTFRWSDAAEAAFAKLKSRFVSAPILVTPDPSRQFVVGAAKHTAHSNGAGQKEK
ncbi:hypothetical protein QQF64_033950 [Cirrhinus molitorella]|uniref:Reverse transcriptase/retrotransposon-derived protein RNase H-like domain-containing protein n=1 Tax=Cirrhinus molitorella TaxID=172907 RepID=A0ABR3MVD2_9TELE